jgi:hypothetical protein
LGGDMFPQDPAGFLLFGRTNVCSQGRRDNGGAVYGDGAAMRAPDHVNWCVTC